MSDDMAEPTTEELCDPEHRTSTELVETNWSDVLTERRQEITCRFLGRWYRHWTCATHDLHLDLCDPLFQIHRGGFSYFLSCSLSSFWTRNEGPRTGSGQDIIALLREETVTVFATMTTEQTQTCSQLSVKQLQETR